MSLGTALSLALRIDDSGVNLIGQMSFPKSTNRVGWKTPASWHGEDRKEHYPSIAAGNG